MKDCNTSRHLQICEFVACIAEVEASRISLLLRGWQK